MNDRDQAIDRREAFERGVRQGKRDERDRAAAVAESMGYFATARAIKAGGDEGELRRLTEERERTIVVRSAGMAAAMFSVACERVRQIAKWGDPNLRDGTGGALSPELADCLRRMVDALNETPGNSFAHVLAEEVLEAYVETEPEKLRAELVQVAAVAVKWIEAIDRGGRDVQLGVPAGSGEVSPCVELPRPARQCVRCGGKGFLEWEER